MALEVREGHIEGGLPCLSFGEGPPLVVFPGLGITNANPKGLQRWGELRLLAALARLHGAQDKPEGRAGVWNDY
jgi:hypothetical protein